MLLNLGHESFRENQKFISMAVTFIEPKSSKDNIILSSEIDTDFKMYQTIRKELCLYTLTA